MKIHLEAQATSILQLEWMLDDAEKRLRVIMQDKAVMVECAPKEQSAMESAARSIGAAADQLKSIVAENASMARAKDRPTRQQGQFLAFIREYIMRNETGIAPSHANFQRFFNLTAPTVNSMLIRLEARGFIRRVSGKARAIELTINPNWIPPLDRPFKL